LLRAPVEQARIDPDNVEILVQHLQCAAFELPFQAGEAFREVPASQTSPALGYLASHAVLPPAEGPTRPATPIVYWPFLQENFAPSRVTVERTRAYAIRSERSSDPGLLSEVQRAVWAVNQSLPLAPLQTVADDHSGSTPCDERQGQDHRHGLEEPRPQRWFDLRHQESRPQLPARDAAWRSRGVGRRDLTWVCAPRRRQLRRPKAPLVTSTD